MPDVREEALSGGRVTPGVVRVGETVHRPRSANWQFVRRLLSHLQERGFSGAPRFLGADEEGREVFTYLHGDVLPDLDPAIADSTLIAAAELIRRFHDATAGAAISDGYETVCHGDLSPCNFVFRNGLPVGIIDFDATAPGKRLQDLGYAVLLWLNLGTDGPPLGEQARRLGEFSAAYGVEADRQIVDAAIDAVTANIERLRSAERLNDLHWWEAQLDWLSDRRDELAALLALKPPTLG